MRDDVIGLLLQRWSGGEGVHPPGHRQRPHAAAGSVSPPPLVVVLWSVWKTCMLFYGLSFRLLQQQWCTSERIQAKRKKNPVQKLIVSALRSPSSLRSCYCKKKKPRVLTSVFYLGYHGNIISIKPQLCVWLRGAVWWPLAPSCFTFLLRFLWGGGFMFSLICWNWTDALRETREEEEGGGGGWRRGWRPLAH